MNQLASKDAVVGVIPVGTTELIKRSVSTNTLKAYGEALLTLEAWLSTAVRNDGLNDTAIAEYTAHLCETGKSPATIAQAVAAVKWQAKNVDMNVVGPSTDHTLAGTLRDSRERGRG